MVKIGTFRLFEVVETSPALRLSSRVRHARLGHRWEQGHSWPEAHPPFHEAFPLPASAATIAAS